MDTQTVRIIDPETYKQGPQISILCILYAHSLHLRTFQETIGTFFAIVRHVVCCIEAVWHCQHKKASKTGKGCGLKT